MRESTMNWKRKSWEERAWELLAEQQADRRLPMGEWVKKRLRWEDWGTLAPEAVRFAAGEVNRRRRRGNGGVLPGGYDAESIAAEAVADLLEGKSELAPGWTRDRLLGELKRLIRRKTQRLASLKERRVTEGGLGVEGANRDNELARRAAQVPDQSGSGSETVMAREEKENRERLKVELERLLEREPELLEVFRCLWAGITKPAEIARRAGIEMEKVGVLRKRLERRLRRFRRGREQR